MENANKRLHVPDMLLYVMAGFLVLAGIWGFIIFVPGRFWPPRKWLEFAFYSLMLFVFLLRFYWRFRRQRKLWVAMLSTLIVHVSLYVSVLTYLDRWPAIWYVVTMPLEAMLIFLIFKKVLNIMPDINVRL